MKDLLNEKRPAAKASKESPAKAAQSSPAQGSSAFLDADSDPNTPLFSPKITFNIGSRNRYDRGYWQAGGASGASGHESPGKVPDQTNVLKARLKLLSQSLDVASDLCEQEKNGLHLYKLRRDKIKSLLLSILAKLLRYPVEALYAPLTSQRVRAADQVDRHHLGEDRGEGSGAASPSRRSGCSSRPRC
jgi:hypothetical protein